MSGIEWNGSKHFCSIACYMAVMSHKNAPADLPTSPTRSTMMGVLAPSLSYLADFHCCLYAFVFVFRSSMISSDPLLSQHACRHMSRSLSTSLLDDPLLRGQRRGRMVLFHCLWNLSLP